MDWRRFFLWLCARRPYVPTQRCGGVQGAMAGCDQVAEVRGGERWCKGLVKGGRICPVESRRIEG